MTTLSGSQARLKARGFKFTWAESAYIVCVRYHGKWIGTFDAHGRPAYSVPAEAREAMYDVIHKN